MPSLSSKIDFAKFVAIQFSALKLYTKYPIVLLNFVSRSQFFSIEIQLRILTRNK